MSFAKDGFVCSSAVNGLNNFQIGFPTAVPTLGSPVDSSSYDVCGSVNFGLPAGAVIDVECVTTTQQYRYVIIQSLNTSAEKLCIAEACVNSPSQYENAIVRLFSVKCHYTDRTRPDPTKQVRGLVGDPRGPNGLLQRRSGPCSGIWTLYSNSAAFNAMWSTLCFQESKSFIYCKPFAMDFRQFVQQLIRFRAVPLR